MGIAQFLQQLKAKHKCSVVFLITVQLTWAPECGVSIASRTTKPNILLWIVWFISKTLSLHGGPSTTEQQMRAFI